uniref:Glutamate rich 3 n=1 Tax=Nannospalax galili TaxID=1026970 RepID=A0A8C6RBG9_NANGA
MFAKSKMAMMKFRSSLDSPQRADSCQLPHINSYLIPVPPPPPPRAGKTVRENGQEAWRRKRFHPIAAPNGSEPLFTRDSSRIYKASPHSNAVITMVYFGKNVHLSYDDTDYRDEIKIYQQHCGGENLCVYKGKLLEKDNFQFVSKRHCGFPFSLTFFLNGIQVNRLSSCCEFKHRRSSRLGGRRGCFGFVCVEKASPCYKCIIAMGLDRKGSSMKSRRENHTDKREESKKGPGKLRQDRENVLSRRNETEGREALSVSFSAEEMKSGIREVTTAVEEMEWRGKPGGAWDEDRENTFKYDYEEDFEVDEKQDERADEGQADDQMSGKSTSEGEKDNLDPEKETETSSEKAPDADDSEIRERDGCSDSEEEKRDIKSASSNSSRSHSYSSESDDDSAQGSGVTLSASSTGSSPRCSSSPELHGITDPGRSHLPAGHSLEAKMDKQEVTADHVENRPLLPEESHECDPEEGRKKGSQVTAESGPAKSRKPAGQRAKGKVVDRDEGLPGVEDGGKYGH